MPHAGFGGTKELKERSDREVIGVFLVMPVILVAILLTAMIGLSGLGRREMTAGEIVGLIVFSLMLVLIAVSLPVVGWQELKKRKRFRQSASSADSKRVPSGPSSVRSNSSN